MAGKYPLPSFDITRSSNESDPDSHCREEAWRRERRADPPSALERDAEARIVTEIREPGFLLPMVVQRYNLNANQKRFRYTTGNNANRRPYRDLFFIRWFG